MSDEHEMDDSDIDVGEDDEVEDSGEIISLESSTRAKELERQRLQSEVEAFLASGGKISRIEANVVSDPPRRPESNYGGQPI